MVVVCLSTPENMRGYLRAKRDRKERDRKESSYV
jgi:hypothetical protein